MAAQNQKGRRVADHLRLVVEPGDLEGKAVHAIDSAAEEATISGSILSANARNTAIVKGVKPEHFWEPYRARVWEAIVALAETEQDGPLDVVLVRRWLRDRGGSEPEGGWLAYLGLLVDATPQVGNIERHCQIVLELAEVRRVVATAQVIVAEGYHPIPDRAEWLRTAPERIAACVTSQAAPTCEDASSIFKRVFDDLEHQIEEREAAEAAGEPTIAGYSTGIQPLDRRVGGLVPTDLTILTGLEKDGKSSLGAQMCASVARRPRRMHAGDPACRACSPKAPCERHAWRWFGSLIFQGEGDRETTLARLAGARARVDLAKLRTGGISRAEFDRLQSAASDIGAYPLKVDDEHTQSVSSIGARVRAVRDEWAAKGITLAVVMIDSLQLLVEEGRTREEELDRATRKLVALKKAPDLREVSWILVNHTNAEGEMTHSKAPRKWCDQWLHLSVGTKAEEDSSGARPANLKVRLSRHTEPNAEVPLWVWRRYNNLFQGGE